MSIIQYNIGSRVCRCRQSFQYMNLYNQANSEHELFSSCYSPGQLMQLRQHASGAPCTLQSSRKYHRRHTMPSRPSRRALRATSGWASHWTKNYWLDHYADMVMSRYSLPTAIGESLIEVEPAAKLRLCIACQGDDRGQQRERAHCL